jgi:hypothetical protein
MYPAKILPRRFFKIINPNLLLGGNYYLIRHTPGKNIYDDNSNLKPNQIASQTLHFLDLSTSLKGIFEEKHVEFDIKKEFKPIYYKKWTPTKKGLHPKSSEIDLFPERGFLLFNLKDFHGKRIPKKKFDHPVDFEVECKIKHAPTKCNYWHFLFKWHDTTNNSVIDEKYHYSRRVAVAAKTLMVENHKIIPHDYNLLSKWYYILIPNLITKSVVKIKKFKFPRK